MKRSAVFLAGSAISLSVALVILVGARPSSANPAASDKPAQCFDKHQILSIIPQDSRTLDVVTNSNQAFELQLGSPCLDRQVQFRPKIESRTGDLICGAGDANVYYPQTNGVEECRVTSVRHMSAEEAAKLVSGAR